MSDLNKCFECHCTSGTHNSWCSRKNLSDGRVKEQAPNASLYAEPIPAVLFRGEAVWRELNDKERTRTTAINVSDVPDAVVRLMRRKVRNEKGQA